MVEVCKYGQMDHDMKDNGVTIELMATVAWSTLKEIFMRVNGSMTKLMEKGRTHKIKEVNIKELGSMINKTDLE